MRRLGSSPSERAQVKNTSPTRDGALPASQRLLFGGYGKGGLSLALGVLPPVTAPLIRSADRGKDRESEVGIG